MSANLRMIPSAGKPKGRRNPIVGRALITAVALTLLVLGGLRAMSHDTGEGLNLHTILSSMFYTIITGGGCMIAELALCRLRRVSPLVKHRRVLKGEQKKLSREYDKAMKAINSFIAQQEAWAGTKTILSGLNDRVFRQRCVHYFRKTKTQPFCACSHLCPNTCICPICHEGGRP